MKLIIFTSLVSMSLSFGVMTRAYTKENLASRDKRFSKAYNVVVSKAINKYGGFGTAKVYPIAAYRNIENGVNYKMITAIEDSKNKRVELVESEVFSPFSDYDEEGEPTIIQERFPNVIEAENPKILQGITDFVNKFLASKNISLKHYLYY